MSDNNIQIVTSQSSTSGYSTTTSSVPLSCEICGKMTNTVYYKVGISDPNPPRRCWDCYLKLKDVVPYVPIINLPYTPMPSITFDPQTVIKEVLDGQLTGDPDMDQMLKDCIEVQRSKGAEYTGGSKDRLANFKGVAEDINEPMEKVWYTFWNKHVRAIASYIKNGCEVKSNEPIQSRIMDCIVYLLLFSKMVKEIEAKKAQSLNNGKP